MTQCVEFRAVPALRVAASNTSQLYRTPVQATAMIDAGSPLEPLLVGLQGPLRGDQRSNGLDIYRGALLAAEQLNAAGGVLGRRVEIVRANDGADPGKALQAARRVRRSGADFVIGPYNSSVGLESLPFYVREKILPLHLTSTDDTSGFGITIQPKNSQISPVEADYILRQNVKRVTMIVDPSAYTVGMADRLDQALSSEGVKVKRITVNPGDNQYRKLLAKALASKPDLLYVSTYFPEGSRIARSLYRTGETVPRFMGLGNVDPGFIETAGLEASRAAVFSGIPEAAQLPRAGDYVKAYRHRFGEEPGVWGTFAYDTMQLLAGVLEQEGTTRYGRVLNTLLQTQGYRGQTGRISIDPLTGNRLKLPIDILRVNRNGGYVVKG